MSDEPEPKEYRRRPEVVRAAQWHKPGDHPDWSWASRSFDVDRPIIVHPGDWILERADGARCVMSDRLFRRDYEPADAATGPGEATRKVLEELAVDLADHDEGDIVLALIDAAHLEAALRECGIEVRP